MSEAGRSLSEVLEGHLPLTANRHLIDAITDVRQRRFMALVLAPGVRLDRKLMRPLAEVLEGMPDGGALDLFIDRLGPASEESWRVVSMIREHFERYTAVVPFAATTAGTQVALGADELMMGEASSLAPVEWPRLREEGRSLVGPGEFMGFIQCVQGVLNQPESAIKADPSIWSHLVEGLDPLVIGASERAMALHRQVLRRSLETHIDRRKEASRLDHIVGRMCGGLLSQAFPVTRRDCEDDLGLTVLRPDRDLWRAVRALHTYYDRMLELEGDFLWSERHFSVTFQGFIDTPGERRVLVRLDRVDERGRPLSDKPALVRWIKPGGQDVVINEPVDL